MLCGASSCTANEAGRVLQAAARGTYLIVDGISGADTCSSFTFRILNNELG